MPWPPRAALPVLCASALSLVLTACPDPTPPKDPELAFETATLAFTAKTNERREVGVGLKNPSGVALGYTVVLPDDASYQTRETVFFDIDPDAVTGTAPAGGAAALTVAMQCPVTPGTYTNTLDATYAVGGQTRRVTLSVTATCEAAPLPTVVADTTRVLDRASTDALAAYDPATGVLTFTGRSPQIDALAKDQVLVTPPLPAAPEGLLVGVLSVERAGTVTTVQTQPAGLMDAFDSADIDLAFSDTGVATGTAQGIRAQALGSSIDTALFDLDGNAATTNDQVRVAGKFSIAPRHEFKHKFAVRFRTYRVFGVKIKVPVGVSLEARIGAGVRQDLNFRLYSTGSLTFKESTEKNLYRKVGTPIVIPVGPVPLTFVPQYTVDARASLEASARFDVGFTQGMQFLAGLQFNNGSLGPYFDQSSGFSRQINALTGSVNGAVTLSGGVTFSLYGVVGPALGVGFGPKFTATTTEGPPPAIDWKLAGCITGEAAIRNGVALNIKLFGFRIPFKIPERRWSLFDSCATWADGRIVIPVNQAPVITNLRINNTQPVPTGCAVIAFADVRDPDGDAMTATWTPEPLEQSLSPGEGGPNDLSAFAQFRRQTFAPGRQTIGLTVRDTKGAQTTQTLDVTFVASEGCPG